jgi:hypothetical protein
MNIVKIDKIGNRVLAVIGSCIILLAILECIPHDVDISIAETATVFGGLLTVAGVAYIIDKVPNYVIGIIYFVIGFPAFIWGLFVLMTHFGG